MTGRPSQSALTPQPPMRNSKRATPKEDPVRALLHIVWSRGWTCGFCNYLNRPEASICESPFYCKGRDG